MDATFVLNDMGTIIKGVTAELHEIPFEEWAIQFLPQITRDNRRDKSMRIENKTQSITSKINRTGAKKA